MHGNYWHSAHVGMQVQAQREHIAEQNQRCRDLEASTRQLDERCSELKESAAGHELRAKEAAAEVLKGNRIIEKVSVRTTFYHSHMSASAEDHIVHSQKATAVWTQKSLLQHFYQYSSFSPQLLLML